MPINAFGGGPGSGKTYGVMEHVILPAIAKGRFVLTNVEGLDAEAIYHYVAEHFYKGKIICIGHIRMCDRAAPDEEDFFPGEEALDKPVPVPSPECRRVVGGDLVVVDEATRYWEQGGKVKRGHAYFFREHRHFSNEMGHTCDLVVIDPDLTLLARALKGKVEMASVTHKPKAVGMDRYVVNIYRGVRLTRAPIQTLGPYAFQKRIYSLYKSYSHENAKEQPIDKRQNILRNPKVHAVVVAVVALWLFGGFFTYRFFTKRGGEQAKSVVDSKSAAPSQTSTATSDVPAPGNAKGGEVGSLSKGNYSDEWRIAGALETNGERYVVVVDSQGRLRVESPSMFRNSGIAAIGEIDGQRVALWTGHKAGVGTVVPSMEGRK